MTQTKTVELPVIPRNVADAIERKRVRDDGEQPWRNADFVIAHDQGFGETHRAIRTLPLDMLLLALTVGYTVERTPEEMAHVTIRQLYEYAKTVGGDWEFFDAYSRGMVQTLSTLGIHIPGVNIPKEDVK